MPTTAAIGYPLAIALPDGREVRRHPVALLGAAHGDAEPGADLVEDEDGAVLVGDLLDLLEVALGRRHDRQRHRMAHGGDDDGRDLAGVLGEDALEIGHIAVGELFGQVLDGLRDAALHLDTPVAPAVVATASDLVAAGVGAGGAHGCVRRIRASLHKDRLLTAGQDVGEALLELVLDRLHEAEAEPLVHTRLDGLVDLGLDVAEDDRPVGAEHVDVLVAVDVEDVPGLAVGDEHGVLADHEVVGPPDAAHASGRQPVGILEHAHRLREIEFGGALDGPVHVGSFPRLCAVRTAAGGE